MLDALFGGGDNGFNEARAALARNRGLYEQIEDPNYLDFSPELLKSETANYELINEDPLVKSAQMSALAKLAGLADTGLSEVDQAGFGEARRLGGQMQKAGTAAALQNAQARGVGGSGLEFALRESANQAGADRAQQAGLQQAADSARQRAMYQAAYGDALSRQRSQDLQAESANKGIINRFNEMNTQNRNAVNNANAGLRNEAFMYNQGLKDKRFENQMRRADGVAGMNNRSAEIASAESAQNQSRRRALAGLAGAGIGYMVAPAGGGANGAMIGNMIGQGAGSY